jgi:uncharacterized RDD family membrane protein YckC
MENKFKIANFWTRVGSFLIDMVILGILGMILGLIFYNFFVNLGKYGYLIGFIITVLYFSILNSNILKGQTLGKMVLGIQVVDKQGKLISIYKSLLRSTILVISYFIVNHPIPFIPEGSFLYTIKALVFSLLSIGIVLLLIFNKETRQSIHDLFVGSYVISKQKGEDSFLLPNISKSPIYITSIVLFILTGFSIYGFSVWNKKYSSLNSVRAYLLNVNGIIDVGVSKNKTTFYGKQDSTISSYTLSLRVKEFPNISNIENSEIVKESIKKLMEVEPDYDQFNQVSIALIKGFDIGIAKQSTSNLVTKTPHEWHNIIK